MFDRSLATTLLLAASGCASAAQPADCPACEPRASAAPCADGPATAAAKDEIDPDVLELANAAKACPYERGSFDWDCPAFKEWRSENDDLFESPGGNATILAMLENDDARLRTLAADRGFVAARAFFADEGRAKRLLAVVSKEGDRRLLPRYGKFVAYINGEKMLGKELEGLVKHPDTDFVMRFAEYAVPQHNTAFSLDLAKRFIEHPDDAVKRAAVGSLSASGRVRPSEPLCALLKAQIARTDKVGTEALDAGATSKCPNMANLVMAEIEKRTAKDPENAGDYSSALTTLCWRSATPAELKKRAFDVAVKVAPKAESTWTKHSFLRLFESCDLSRAKAALQPYLKDKDKDTQERAKEILAEVERQLAKE